VLRGLDGMQTGELRSHVNQNWQALRKDISEGTYRVEQCEKQRYRKPGGSR